MGIWFYYFYRLLNEFYKGSLYTIASNLEDNDFKHLMLEFSTVNLVIIIKKDPYPYEWVDSYEKFRYTSLPEKKYSYLSLRDGKRDRSDGHISHEQYQYLQNVSDIFNVIFGGFS